MEAFLLSAAIVAVAEVGDKTQLLSLVLITRYRQPVPILLGIVLATLVNHAAAAWIGHAAATWMDPTILRYLLGASFLAMALWVLLPDAMDDEATPRYGGVLLTTLALFFLAEIGDKTQIATIALGARYENVAAVVAGTTLGMLLANAPVVLGGRYIMQRLPLHWMRRAAAFLFAALGVATLLSPVF